MWLLAQEREKSSIESAVNLSYSAIFFRNNEWRHLFGSPEGKKKWPGRPTRQIFCDQGHCFSGHFFVTLTMARVFFTRATALHERKKKVKSTIVGPLGSTFFADEKHIRLNMKVTMLLTTQLLDIIKTFVIPLRDFALGSLATIGTVFHCLYIFLYHLLGFCAPTYYFRNLQIKISLHSQNNFKNYHCALRFSSCRRDPASLLESLFMSVSQQLEGIGGRLKCSFLFWK